MASFPIAIDDGEFVRQAPPEFLLIKAIGIVYVRQSVIPAMAYDPIFDRDTIVVRYGIKKDIHHATTS